MSGLLNKLTDQLSNQNKPQGGQQAPSSSTLLHKVTDAVTGQKHPQDYQNHPDSQSSGYGYGAGPGPGYQQSGHPGILGPLSILSPHRDWLTVDPRRPRWIFGWTRQSGRTGRPYRRTKIL